RLQLSDAQQRVAGDLDVRGLRQVAARGDFDAFPVDDQVAVSFSQSLLSLFLADQRDFEGIEPRRSRLAHEKARLHAAPGAGGVPGTLTLSFTSGCAASARRRAEYPGRRGRKVWSDWTDAPRSTGCRRASRPTRRTAAPARRRRASPSVSTPSHMRRSART